MRHIGNELDFFRKNRTETKVGDLGGLGNGDCVRHRSEYKDHIWSYNFVHERTKDKLSFRILTIIDEFTRESLGAVVRRRFTSLDVSEFLSELFITRGLPKHILSDNGPEFT
jgi:putative transposase